MESNDAAVLGCLGWAIEKHLHADFIETKTNFSDNFR